MVFVEDCIDIVLMRDDNYIEECKQAEKDAQLGISDCVFQESVTDIFSDAKCSGEIRSDDVPAYNFSPVDEVASNYLDACNELCTCTSPYGNIIDIVSM